MFTNGSCESFLCAILESFVFDYLTQLMEIRVREMPLNRRRWSNELIDSLIDFQNKTCSELDDSLNKNEEVCPENLLNDRCTNVDTESSKVLSTDVVDNYNEVSMPTLILSSSETSDRDKLNLTMLENSEKKDLGNTNIHPILNNKIIENITASSDGTAKYFSCDSSSNQNTIDTQSVRSQSTQYSCEIFHEAITFNYEEVIENKENPNSQVNESNQRDQSNEVSSKNEATTKENRFSLNLMGFDRPGEMGHRYFSSPVEFPNLDKEQLGEIDHPDIWDALLELDQALSPFGEEVNSSEEKQSTPNLLSRLSEKFKKTPSRFTERLISILEDSIISTESPTKHNAADGSGISLHRMTGEFRKLCKFIEDESMPEWAPSMANITALCAEKTETPETEKAQKNPTSETPKNMIRRIQDTPTLKSSPLALKALLTPKNKVISRNQTPIKKFTPSADKSFEYWEKICNLMCDPSSAEKIKSKTPAVQEGSKLSMDEILTICERQMASLDDSTTEVRTSEPCKKTDSEIKLNVLQAPRSKSVSKMYESSEKKVKSSSKKKKVQKVDNKVYENTDLKLSGKKDSTKEENLINLNITVDDTVIMSDSDTTSDDSSFLKRRVFNSNYQDSFKADWEDVRVNEQKSFDYDYELLRNPKSEEQKSFENDFQLIAYSPQERQSKKESEISYDPDDPDCSLIAELALRRQRCLETAKLMMEIDQEYPMTNDDNTCVETLYKLGIQDKTFVEVEEDTKFVNTLNQCLEYRSYLSEKKTPIIKALQKFDTPEELKKKTTSIIRSQSQVSTRKPLNKSTLQRANSAKTLHDGNRIPKLAANTAVSKVTPRVSRTFSNLGATPRISATTPRVSLTTPRVTSTTPRVSSTAAIRPMPRSTSKLTPQVTKTNLHPQSEHSKLAHKLPTKMPQSLQKPPLRRPILKLSPKTTRKLTPPSDMKPCTPRPAAKLTPPTELKSCTPTQTIKLTLPSETKLCTPISARKLTPPSELKPCTPSPAIKLTPLSETKIITTKPTPKQVKNLKNPTEITPCQKNTPRPRFFVSPGQSPSVAACARKKPASYFSEKATKSPLTAHKFNHDIKSPIGLYINSVDNDLIQNVHAKTNDRLLTPVSYGENGKSPQLKIRLASKENQLPTVNFNENVVLPTIRYHSAKNVRLIDTKSNYSPSPIAPNSRTKKLLESIENTKVIRHEGRMVADSNTDYLNAETSIRVQKVAEKTTPLRR